MITKKTCPECGSDNISFISGDGEHGAFMCRACGNTGTFDEETIINRGGSLKLKVKSTAARKRRGL